MEFASRNRWIRNNYLDVSKIIKSIHENGGIYTPAHFFRGWDPFGESVLEIDGIDTIETHNGLNSEE